MKPSGYLKVTVLKFVGVRAWIRANWSVSGSLFRSNYLRTTTKPTNILLSAANNSTANRKQYHSAGFCFTTTIATSNTTTNVDTSNNATSCNTTAYRNGTRNNTTRNDAIGRCASSSNRAKATEKQANQQILLWFWRMQTFIWICWRAQVKPMAHIIWVTHNDLFIFRSHRKMSNHEINYEKFKLLCHICKLEFRNH